jgi:hypothetical protein
VVNRRAKPHPLHLTCEQYFFPRYQDLRFPVFISFYTFR